MAANVNQLEAQSNIYREAIESRRIPPHARPKQLLRAFCELKARLQSGLDREVCLADIGAFTAAGQAGIGISQIGSRVIDLEACGCKIDSVRLPGHHKNTYFLRSYPADIVTRIEHFRAKTSSQTQQEIPWSERRRVTGLALWDGVR